MIARSSEVFTAYRHAPYHGMTDDCPKLHYITSSILYVKIASLVGRVSVIVFLPVPQRPRHRSCWLKEHRSLDCEELLTSRLKTNPADRLSWVNP